MTAIFITLFILLGVYIISFAWLAIGFVKTRQPAAISRSPDPPVTIIVCARNEEKNIARCIRSILWQKYKGNLQLLVVNDASTDSTVAQAESVLLNSRINYRIFTNPVQKGKKLSITFAMRHAEHDLVILRDADTFTLSEKWLQRFADLYAETNAAMIIGPVAIANNYGLLWALQAIENNVLAVLSCGSAYYHRPFLCSGANLAFTKKSFELTDGFSSHSQIASGDDVLLMEDIRKKGLPVRYLKSQEAVVHTFPAYSFRSLLSQRIRWASKFRINTNRMNLLFAVLAFLVNTAWIFCLSAAYLVPGFKELSLLFILIKISIDLLLLFLASGFMKNHRVEWYAMPAAFVYPVYAVIISLGTLFYKPQWKK
jgi:poly-beta-1,6-N-acetyl-D-glucosamine synthase